MSSTPEVWSLVLRDDLPAPDTFDGEVGAGATLLVARESGPTTRTRSAWRS